MLGGGTRVRSTENLSLEGPEDSLIALRFTCFLFSVLRLICHKRTQLSLSDSNQYGPPPSFLMWTETYPLSEWSCSFVEYRRVNKVQKQTSSELKSLFVTDVTGIRAELRAYITLFRIVSGTTNEFIAEQFVIKLDIPLCVPVFSYKKANIRVM